MTRTYSPEPTAKEGDIAFISHQFDPGIGDPVEAEVILDVLGDPYVLLNGYMEQIGKNGRLYPGVRIVKASHNGQ